MQYAPWCVARKWKFAGKHLIENHAKRIDVARWADFVYLTFGLFGRHVGRSAEDSPLLRQLVAARHRLAMKSFCQTKIENL